MGLEMVTLYFPPPIINHKDTVLLNKEKVLFPVLVYFNTFIFSPNHTFK